MVSLFENSDRIHKKIKYTSPFLENHVFTLSLLKYESIIYVGLLWGRRP
jgi:hypothetical protein